MTDLDEKQTDSSDEYEEEALVHDQDEREPIHNTRVREMDIIKCIGQLTIEYKYNENGLYYRKTLGTGTVISVIDGTTALVLTSAHNIRTFVLECPKCHEYYNINKKYVNGNKSIICSNKINNCNENISSKSNWKMIKATGITFRRRTTKFGADFGRMEGMPYKCKVQLIDDINYKTFHGTSQGYDIAILSFTDSSNYYRKYCRDIAIQPCDHDKLVDMKQFNMFGYPGEDKKRGKMYGGSSKHKEWELKLNKITEKKYFKHREVDSSCGQSGAALWFQKNNKFVIFGLHSGGSSESKYNIATLFNGDKFVNFIWENKYFEIHEDEEEKCISSFSEIKQQEIFEKEHKEINVMPVKNSGWLEKKSRHLGKWRKRFIVLHEGSLISYKTEDMKKQTEYIDLKKYSNVCKAGSLSFDIYNRNKIAFSFRVQSYDDNKLWIDFISAAIVQAKQCDNIVSVSPDKLFKKPKIDHVVRKEVEWVAKGGLLDISTTNKTPQEVFIHTNLRVRKNELLRCKFAKKIGSKHPELLVYGTEPEFDNDQLIRLDLICIDDKGNKINKVRLQSKSWGELKNRDCNELEYPITKTLKQITTFCFEYQTKNNDYSYGTNNCRKFMIELCVFLKIKFPDAYPFEDKWYNIQEASLRRKKKVVKPQENDDNKQIHDITEETKEELNYDQMNCDQLFQMLFDQNILKCKENNDGLFDEYLDFSHVFVKKQAKIDEFKYAFQVLLVNNGHYFSYQLLMSYEQLKIIDDAMNKMGHFFGFVSTLEEIKQKIINQYQYDNFNQTYKTAPPASIKNKIIEKTPLKVWIYRRCKAPLLHYDECDDCLSYYAMYIQVLFMYNKETDYICGALKFPIPLSALIAKLTNAKKTIPRRKYDKIVRYIELDLFDYIDYKHIDESD
eukprot:105421_1